MPVRAAETTEEVKWHSPSYGSPRYDESKHTEVRFLDIHEDDQLDEAQFAGWVKQASPLPGCGRA